MRSIAWQLAVLVLTALSLAPSFAHLLEAGPRLARWSPELWRDATVFGGLYQFFGVIGGPLDIAAVIVTAILAYMMRGERVIFRFALTGAVMFTISLVCWLSIVAPANAILATWTPGPLPADFFAVRNRWESSHIIMAVLKIIGFVSMSLSAVLRPAAGYKVIFTGA